MNQIKAGAVLNYVIVILNIITGLLYTPFMLRCLGQNEYGLYSLVASVITYLTLLDFGFGSSIVRYTAKIRATRPKEEEWSLYGMFMAAYIVIGILVTIGGVFLYFNTDRMFDRTMTPDELSQARIMMALMVGNLAVSFPLSIFGSIISAYEKFVFQRILTLSRIILSTIILIVVLLMGFKAIGLVVVQTIFSLATLLINFLYCHYKLKIHIIFRNFNLQLLKDIAIFSFWNFTSAIVDRIYWSTGQFILGIYSGTVAVAIFSLAITMMHLYMGMSTSINSVLLPRITVLASKNGTENEISNLFIKTGRLQFCVMALIVSGFTIFGKAFINLWAGPDYSTSFIITLIFLIALLCPLIQNVGISILMARGQQKFRSLTYLGIAIMSIIGQIVVTRKYGAVGCAAVIGMTLFIGQWIIMNIYYQKVQHIDIRNFWHQIIKMAICPVCFTILGFLITERLDFSTWWRLAAGILLYSCTYLPAFYISSMNRYERNTVLSPFYSLVNRLYCK